MCAEQRAIFLHYPVSGRVTAWVDSKDQHLLLLPSESIDAAIQSDAARHNRLHGGETTCGQAISLGPETGPLMSILLIKGSFQDFMQINANRRSQCGI